MEKRGFSLVELMIAMVLLAIGILATMAMQFTAQSGYMSAREATGANDLARTAEQLVRAEARGWSAGQAPSADTVFSNQPGFFDAMGNDGSWQVVTTDPITYRSTDQGPGRFCVYAAGDELGDDDRGYMRVAIAVVYPAARSAFDDDQGCGDPAITGSGNDGPRLDSSNRVDLELEGFRSVHLTTAVRASSDQFQ